MAENRYLDELFGTARSNDTFLTMESSYVRTVFLMV